MQLLSKVPGNTCLKDVPEDYAPSNGLHWLTLPEGRDQGKKLFFYDYTIGEGSVENIYFFVHGNPESSYTYRKVVSDLVDRITTKGAAARLIALDHIGFGLSDQATYEMVDFHHAGNLCLLLEHLSLDLRYVHLVVHDWGGPIGIGAFLRQRETIQSLTVLNSTVFPIPLDGITYSNFPLKALPWSKTPFLPDSLWGAHAGFTVTQTGQVKSKNLLPNYVRYQLMAKFNRLPTKDKDAQKVYMQQFSSAMNAKSSKRMVMQTPVWGHGYSYVCPRSNTVFNNTQFYKDIQNEISVKWKEIPVNLVLGLVDPLAKESVVEQWKRALPQLSEHVHRYENDSHFIAETRHREIAEILSSYVNAQ